MEPHSGLNNLDYTVIGVVLSSGVLALMRGFVRELFSLFAWIGAYFASVHFYQVATPWVQHYIKNEKMAEWGAMAAVFVAVLILLAVVGNIVALFIKGPALTTIDRSLGFLYGLLRGAVVVCLIYLGAVLVLWPDIDKPAAEQAMDKNRNMPPEILVEAKTRHLISMGAKRLAFLIPEDLVGKTLQEYSEQKKNAHKEIERQTQEFLGVPSGNVTVPVTTPAPQGSEP